MRYGVCIGIDKEETLAAAAELGYDYVECGFQWIARCEDSELEKAAEHLEKYNIKCEAANCFLPGEFSLTSTDVDREALAAFVERGMSRGEKIGLKTVVFGSGGARKIVDGVSYGEAFVRIVDFLKTIAAPSAARHGITIVLEPLRFKECNIINTVKEGVMVAAATGADNVAGLADIYHMADGHDDFRNIINVTGWLRHAHISNPVYDDDDRCYPVDKSEYDYEGFIAALEAAGCQRCSIEATCQGNFRQTAAKSIALLKSL